MTLHSVTHLRLRCFACAAAVRRRIGRADAAAAEDDAGSHRHADRGADRKEPGRQIANKFVSLRKISKKLKHNLQCI